jgi:iron-sulfur cluster assembly accessory protein
MLEVTSPALEKLKEVMEEQSESDAALRVIAVPGEHGGVQYMMTMEKETQKDDTIMDLDGIRFLMDSDSEPFLEEATIDYVEDLTRVGFIINNPMFSGGGCGSGCGCGAGAGGCGCGAGGCGSH